MAEPQPQTAHGGIFKELTALLAAKLAYLRARLELAGIESKEALVNLAIVLAMAAGALVLILFGYLLCVLAVVFLIAGLCGGGNAWIWVMLGAGVLHFLTALGFALWAKSRLSRPMFAASLEEFRKDQEWLTRRAKPN